MKKIPLLERSGNNTDVTQMTPLGVTEAGRELAKSWNNPEFQYF